MANSPKAKLMKVGDMFAVVLPRGSRVVFHESKKAEAQWCCHDLNVFGKDCALTGMFWGASLTLLTQCGYGVYRAYKAKKSMEKQEEPETTEEVKENEEA